MKKIKECKTMEENHWKGITTVLKKMTKKNKRKRMKQWREAKARGKLK